MYLADVNIITQFICGIDMYVWLLLYYLYSNLYKESIIKMGSFAPPLWGKNEKLIKKEIEKIDKKLEVEVDEKKKAKLNEKKAEYENMLSESEK